MNFNEIINVAIHCISTSSLNEDKKIKIINALEQLKKEIEEINEDLAILTEVINTSNYADELNREYERLKNLSLKE